MRLTKSQEEVKKKRKSNNNKNKYIYNERARDVSFCNMAIVLTVAFLSVPHSFCIHGCANADFRVVARSLTKIDKN